jgi:error-prone DNA polymerase
MTAYAELQVTSNYSFLRGASHPHELALQAAVLGHEAIAITDRNTLAGAARMHVACKQHDIRLIVGARLDLRDGPSFLCFPTDRTAYGRLSQLLTLGKRRAEKGDCELFLDDILEGEIFAAGAAQVLVLVPPETLDPTFREAILKIINKIKKNIYLSVNYIYFGDDIQRISSIAGLANEIALPLVATNDVHTHIAGRRILQDVLTCIREHCTIHEAGFHLHANGERHLKPGDEMARLFSAYPEAIENTVRIAEKCTFNLEELRYEYPVDPVPDGRTPQEKLSRLSWEGAATRYPDGIPEKVKGQIDYELKLIDELGYAPYFLTIHDIVRFARSRDILCQGRGSAANSSVCYMLGITEVNPAEIDLLFERFVSTERDEPPDIDVDFEHERREEVIQYIYEKYGRHRAGLTATHITYRSKSAFREIGKVMGLTEDSIQALSSSVAGGKPTKDRRDPERIREVGLDPEDPTLQMVFELSEQIAGFPRHLSQHTGGFVITSSPLDTVVPIENATMEDRTVIEWDKNDLDALGILKVDILALGMLTCVRKAFEFIEKHHGRKLSLANIPQGDEQTYDMLCEGDSVGVFQVESRAQMNMLPRLRPRTFYDLVIEVAIVRPGPIQGDMVHPYLRRRDGKEEVEYPKEELRAVLEKTMGVPLFQEQAMKIAIVAAGFTPSEADGLRRAMATFRRNGTLPLYRERFINGMIENGYTPDFSERCFKQIEGFSDYGFPESHAASFALLVYVSSWLKCHYPAAFAAALLNSQPMGFYKPAQIVRDARDHGVEVRPVDVNDSDWDCTLETVLEIATPSHVFRGRGNGRWRSGEDARTVIRLGFRQIKGMREDDADGIVDARELGYAAVPDLKQRAGTKRGALECLARADAFQSMGLDRRQALWAVKGLQDAPALPLFSGLPDHELRPEPAVVLPRMHLGEQVADDYLALKMSLKAHPMELLRPCFDAEKQLRCEDLINVPVDSTVRLSGLVLIRQRPGSAKGVIFVTIEDETGVANLIVWPHRMERYRRTLLGSHLLGVEGKLQREGIVTHVVADRLFDFSYRLGYLTSDEAPLLELMLGRNVPSYLPTMPNLRKMIPRSRDFQ